MGYIHVSWPESQAWLDFVQIDEETGESEFGDINYGQDSSVYVLEEVYLMGPDAYADEIGM